MHAHPLGNAAAIRGSMVCACMNSRRREAALERATIDVKRDLPGFGLEETTREAAVGTFRTRLNGFGRGICGA